MVRYSKKQEYRKKFLVIHNGSNLSICLRKKNENLKILSIGINTSKRFWYCYKAINEVREIVESYTILGEGNDKKYLKALF